jgi:predicted RNA binding protein YcfA (HicA-like mRNA interferase family)
MEKLVFYLGFTKTRQKGSHAFYKHNDGRATSIPHHKEHDLAKPLIGVILSEIRISVDEYNDLLDKI